MSDKIKPGMSEGAVRDIVAQMGDGELLAWFEQATKYEAKSTATSGPFWSTTKAACVSEIMMRLPREPRRGRTKT